MILADSNLIIYVASGKYPDLNEWFVTKGPVVSAVTLLEVSASVLYDPKGEKLRV